MFSLIGTALATSGNSTISVFYNNIKVTLDGKTIPLKDASGNIVEPFIYNGTTYLPIRAVGSALGLKVAWNADTNTATLTSPPKAIFIIVDDDCQLGTCEAYRKLYLSKHTPVTFAVVPTWVGTNRYDNWDDLLDMHANYDVELIMHGYDHTNLKDKTVDQAVENVQKAKAVFESKGLPSDIMAYPFNQSTAKLREALQSYLRCALQGLGANDLDYNTYPLYNLGLYRYPLFRSDSSLDPKLADVEAWMDKVIAADGVGILMSHSYLPGFNIEIIEKVIDYGEANGAAFMHVKDALDYADNIVG
jgi:peptidoglycan/xylan/chitin deacetylase (PgdA/CDA1 family)